MTATATPEDWAMVEANMGLVYRHANRMPPERRDDAVQDGMFGLLRAAQKFDPGKGFTFATYAEAWIRNAIGRGRGQAEGANYRRALVEGTVYDRGVPLDREVSEDGVTIGDLIGADVDVESEAITNATLDTIADNIDRLARDDIDRDLLVMMLDEHSTDTCLTIAERHGWSRYGIERRRNALRRRLAHRIGVDA